MSSKLNLPWQNRFTPVAQPPRNMLLRDKRANFVAELNKVKPRIPKVACFEVRCKEIDPEPANGEKPPAARRVKAAIQASLHAQNFTSESTCIANFQGTSF